MGYMHENPWRRAMKQILVYGDSLTWGIIPLTRGRFAFDKRWPGVLEAALARMGCPARVSENCLNGRRTVWDDPFKPGRNGLAGLGQLMEIHSPLDLVILMLGTNDFQSMHQYNAWHSAQGTAALVDAIRKAPIEPGMPVPGILVVAPPRANNPRGPIAPKFEEAEEKSAGLRGAFAEVCRTLDCRFFAAEDVITVSKVDGVHLDEDQHAALGEALASTVAEILGS